MFYFILKLWYHNAHVGNSSLPDSRFLLITNDNPPTSDVPLMIISNIEPNIMKVWIKSVHTTARKPPYLVKHELFYNFFEFLLVFLLCGIYKIISYHTSIKNAHNTHERSNYVYIYSGNCKYIILYVSSMRLVFIKNYSMYIWYLD